MSKISVIIPVYNAEKYLEKCINSVLEQTYSDFELILIDDGSKDGSLEICKKFEKSDNRIKLYGIENSGVSFARNFGIEKSTGEYITFIDSDDYVSRYLLDVLYSNSERESSDITIAKLLHKYDMNYEKEEEPQNFNVEIWNSKETLRELMNTKKTSFFPVCKLFKRELLLKNKFDSKYKLAEDALFLTDILLENDLKVLFCDISLYYYVHREGSATTTVNDSVFDTIKVYENMLPRIERKYPDLSFEISNRKYWAYFTVLDKIINEKKYQKEVKEIRRKIISGFFTILKDGNFRIIRKISLFSLLISSKLYAFLINMK